MVIFDAPLLYSRVKSHVFLIFDRILTNLGAKSRHLSVLKRVLLAVTAPHSCCLSQVLRVFFNFCR